MVMGVGGRHCIGMVVMCSGGGRMHAKGGVDCTVSVIVVPFGID